VIDPARQNHVSPLMSYEQWRALFSEAGFQSSCAMQGLGPLARQAVMVAVCSAQSSPAAEVDLHVGAHLLVGAPTSLRELTGDFLIEQGATNIVLAAPRVGLHRQSQLRRSSSVEADDHTRPRRRGLLRAPSGEGTVRYLVCDASNDQDVLSLMMAVRVIAPRLAGVLQMSPFVISGTALADQSEGAFRAAYASKARSVRVLHATGLGTPLSYFSSYASTAGLAGPANQSPAAAATAWLGAFSAHRATAGLPAQIVQWGGFTGMAGVLAGASSQTDFDQTQTMGAVDRDTVWRCLHAVVSPLASRGVAVMPERWFEMLADRQPLPGWAFAWDAAGDNESRELHVDSRHHKQADLDGSQAAAQSSGQHAIAPHP